MPDYLPRRDADLCQWTATLAAQVSASPDFFKLTPEVVADYLERHERFRIAYARTVSNVTDSTSAIAEKNDARRSLAELTRAIVKVARSQPDNESMLMSLSLHPRKPPTRIGKPTSIPIVDLLELRGRFATIRLRDPETPSRRGMPRGVHFGSIYTCVTDGETPTAVAGWRHLLNTSRARREIVLPHDPTTTHVWLCARWVNPRGKPGMASTPVDVSGWHRVMKMPSLPLRWAA